MESGALLVVSGKSGRKSGGGLAAGQGPTAQASPGRTHAAEAPRWPVRASACPVAGALQVQAIV